MRGTVGGAGRAATGRLPARAGAVFGASWIDISNLQDQARAAVGSRRVNHFEPASGAGATIGVGTASPAWASRPAQSVSAVAEGQRLAAADDRRSSEDAPPRQRGAAGRWANGRGLIDSSFRFRRPKRRTHAKAIAAFVPE